MLKKLLIYLICTLTLLPCFTAGVNAEEYGDDSVYKTYIYNNKSEPVITPSAFAVEKVLKGSDITGTNFNELSDVFYDNKGKVYFCDTKNDRVVITDSDFKLIAVISDFIFENRSEKLKEPQGMYSDGKTLYISDTGNNRIVVFDIENQDKALKMINAPELPLLDEEIAFKPTRLTADNSGGIYVIAEGINQGIVWLDSNGSFIGFIGAPKVEFTPLELISWNFATKEQKKRMQSFVPTEYNSLVRDANGFLYVTSQTSSVIPIGKLNSNGENILKSKGYYADENYITNENTEEKYAPNFQDVALGTKKSGFYYAADSKSSKIYCYGKEGEMLFSFGGNGNQNGTFDHISAIEFLSDEKLNRHRLVVTDSSKGLVTVFRETDFGVGIREAVSAYDAGRYEEAAAFWNEVNLADSGYIPAAAALAKIEIQNGEYKNAMERLYAVRDYPLYSEAFEKWRSDFIRDKFIWVIAAITLIIAAAVFVMKSAGKIPAVKKLSATETGRGYKYGTYVMFHPFDGFWDLKREKRGNMKSAMLIAILFFILYAAKLQYSGYIVSGKDPSEVNVLYNLALIFFPLCFYVIANWCITTLMDGKGNLKDIIIATCYALKPYVIISIPMLIISHILTADELVFYHFAEGVAIIWIFALLFFGLMMTHDYSLSKALLSVVLIIVGICLIIFILLLVFNVIQEVYLFAYNMYTELDFRSYL